MLRLFGVDRVKALSAKGRSMFPTRGGGRGSTQKAIRMAKLIQWIQKIVHQQGHTHRWRLIFTDCEAEQNR